jgi:hypothetical protein
VVSFSSGVTRVSIKLTEHEEEETSEDVIINEADLPENNAGDTSDKTST